MRKIGVVGSGEVGKVLSDGFIANGWDVMRGTRDPEKLAEWKDRSGGQAFVGTFAETAQFGDVVVLAAKGSAAFEVLDACGPSTLAGKTVIDAMNPIVDAPPVNGVLKFFTTLDDSLMERLQRRAPDAKFVKAFSCVGSAFMVQPDFGGLKPTMFVCGNDAGAKREVEKILVEFGWESVDMGGAEAARAIEPLCMLWCLPGFLRNEWTHAFKLLRKPE
jgi:predicted dinucleotide-binding enzyme